MIKFARKVYDLLDIFSFDLKNIFEILNLASDIKKALDKNEKIPTLKNKYVISLFYEVSTRTRISFELATKKLDGYFIHINERDTSEKKGENILHTMKALESMKVDILILRHPQSGIAHFLSEKYPFAIINAGDGIHEHPSQAIIDLFTIMNFLNIKNNLNVLFIGDCFYSRAFRSNFLLFQKLNFKISIYAPPNLVDPYLKKLNCSIKYSIENALENADIIYASRIQTERNSFLSKEPYYKSIYTLDLEKYARYIKKEVLILHPGPVNLNIELSDEIDNHQNTKIWEQVKNSIPVRMAILKWIDKQII